MVARCHLASFRITAMPGQGRFEAAFTLLKHQMLKVMRHAFWPGEVRFAGMHGELDQHFAGLGNVKGVSGFEP